MATGVNLFCSQCGRPFGETEILTLGGATVCAACKPVLLRKLQEGVPVAGGFRYMGFWIRVVEYFVDGICIEVVLFPLQWHFLFGPMLRAMIANPGVAPVPVLLVPIFSATYIVLNLATIMLVVAYDTLLWGRFGATLGNMAIGAKVVNLDGGAIGYGRALARALMKIVSGWMLCIGFLMAAFDDQKRTLHDRVAGTLVVAKRP